MQVATVSEALHGGRLEQAVAALFSMSRKEARLAILRGQVSLGRRACKILSRGVKVGQRVTLMPYAPEQAAARQPEATAEWATGALCILHQCDDLIAVNKPSGLLSEGDRFGAPSVESVLAQQLRRSGERHALWLVHRLDAGTSGVLLLARSARAARSLFGAFRERRVQKNYEALVAGDFAQPARCQQPLARVRGTQQGVVAPNTPGAKEASTQFRPLARAHGYTWVQARPLTGRTHQIRVHLAHLGHPILGDGLYGGPRTLPQAVGHALSVARPMLHAAQLSFVHPTTGQKLTLAAPVPDDFSALLLALGLAGRVHAAACKPHPAAKKPPKPNLPS